MTEILRETSGLRIPLEEIWRKSQYQNVKHSSLINLFLSKNKMAEHFDGALNDMFLHALRRYKNLDIILCMGMDVPTTQSYYQQHWKDKFVRFGIKNYQITKDVFFKILYQLHYDNLEITNKDMIKDFMNHQYRVFRDMNDDARIDMTIMIMCKKSKMSILRTIKEDNFCVYVPETELNKWILSTIFLNENTMKFLEYQEFKFYAKREYETSRRWIQSYRNFYFREFNSLDQSQIMLFSSVILYFLGHRNCNDLDIMAHELSDEGRIHMLDLRERHQRPEETEKRFVSHQQHPTYFMDISIKHTEHYPKYWNQWLNEWAREYGAKYFEEILGNGEYHCYFLGMKMVSLDCDIVRRRLRNRPYAMADLIAMRKRYHSIPIDIPVIRDTYTRYIHVDSITEEEKNQYLENGGILDERNQEILIEKKIDKTRYMEDVQRGLMQRYHLDITFDDLKQELHFQTSPENQNIRMVIRQRHENDITIGNIMRNMTIQEEKPTVVEEVKEKEIKPVFKKKTKKIIS